QGAAQRRAVGAAWDDGAGGAVEADAGDVGRGGARAGERFGDGGADGGPPLEGVLFGPGGLRGGRGQRGGGEGTTVTGRVEEGGADALGADVEAEEQRGTVAHGCGLPWEGGMKKGAGRCRPAPCSDHRDGATKPFQKVCRERPPWRSGKRR